MLRLSSAQVLRITDSIGRLNPRDRCGDLEFAKYEIEDLVEDILKEVLPWPLAENKNVLQNSNAS